MDKETKNDIKILLKDIKDLLSPDKVKLSPEDIPQFQNHQETRTAQIGALGLEYLHDFLQKALKLHESREFVVDAIRDRIEELSPNSLINLYTSMNTSTTDHMKLMLEMMKKSKDNKGLQAILIQTLGGQNSKESDGVLISDSEKDIKLQQEIGEIMDLLENLGLSDLKDLGDDVK